MIDYSGYDAANDEPDYEANQLSEATGCCRDAVKLILGTIAVLVGLLFLACGN